MMVVHGSNISDDENSRSTMIIVLVAVVEVMV